MAKKTEQTYVERLEAVEKTIKEGDKGLIVDVQEQTNVTYFKVSQNYGEKPGIAVFVKINSPNVETFSQWFHLSENPRGFEKSNIFLFKNRYGKFPQKGVEVDVKINSEGFYEIVI